MTVNIKESKHGSIILDFNEEHLKNWEPSDRKPIAFISNGLVFEGNLIGTFKENNLLAIKMKTPFPFCVDKTDPIFQRLDINDGYVFFIKDTSIKYIDLDDFGLVKKPNFDQDFRGTQKYKINDIVLVQVLDAFKCGKIIRSGEMKGIRYYEIKVGSGNDTDDITVLEKNLIEKLSDDNGYISVLHENLQLELDNSVISNEIGSGFLYSGLGGILRWKGRVNGLECVGIDNRSNDVSDFSFLTKEPKSYWIMIPFNKDTHSVEQRKSPINPKRENKVEPASIDQQRPTPSPRYSRSDSDSTRARQDIKYKEPVAKLQMVEPQDIILSTCEQSIFTIVNSMFVFTEMFDSLIWDRESVRDKEMCDHLVSKIVIPLRSEKEINPNEWKKLAELIKKGRRGDDDEILFEQLLKQIGFSYSMYNMTHKESIRISTIDLSRRYEFPKLKLNELMNSFCLENNYLIVQPPKCLILRLVDLERKNLTYSNIQIPSKLDITKLTVTCDNCCSVCSSEANFICDTCSREKSDITYFCRDHKTHCKHTKTELEELKKEFRKINGKIELELSSIICRNGSEFHAYVKTIDVKGKWLRFTINDKGCSFTEIDLKSYFTNQHDTKDSKILEGAVLCFYKNPAMEFYWNGF